MERQKKHQAQTTILRRFTVKAGKWEPFLDSWRREVKLRQKYGFRVQFAFQDPKENTFTWGYRFDGDIEDAEKRFGQDPAQTGLAEKSGSFVYTNETVRPVIPTVTTDLTGSCDADLLLRRYSIKAGEWDNFLPLWEDAMKIRERYGFNVLLGLIDEEENMFTWALGYDGDIHAVSEQYYKDPAQNTSMEKIQNYVTDFKVIPVRQVEVFEGKKTPT